MSNLVSLRQTHFPQKVDHAKSNFFSDKTQLSTFQQSEESIQIWAWLNQGHFSEKTKEVYARIVRQFLQFHWHQSLKSITPALVTLYLKKLDAVKPTTRNLHRNALSSLFQYLENTGFIVRSPVKVVRQEKVIENFHYKILSFDQIIRMAQKSSKKRDRLIVLTLYFTGLRVSELAQVKVRDFAVSSRRHQNQGAYLTVIGKGSKLRTVLTGPYLWAEITKYIKSEKLKPDDYLFSYEGDALSRVTIFKIIKEATKNAQIEVVGDKTPSPHWFRHSSAIHALENGADIHVVQSTLGHASLATTGQYLRSRPVKSNAQYLEAQLQTRKKTRRPKKKTLKKIKRTKKSKKSLTRSRYQIKHKAKLKAQKHKRPIVRKSKKKTR